ncbi:N-acetyldiaminopimelate deacetylase [Caldibacillus lycopersici]|uniref:N-acetyldiaminopimelate deacetylase n=1 Tax=Perspicuibacillus lycopersici TaxID=1325689 RepID=A0AAE3LLU1_9BACI|nr:N-acetyldiaminopimelate deacetylase [Perspicuibacillus lycopersici]MCU9612266.1 N-acetyldiaminopimelate deacetylase [Perspicuibacillus lycopersici]
MTDYIKIRRDLHQIPELGFQEFKTNEYIMSILQALPQDRMEIKTWKTGIFVKVKGTNPRKMIGYRTDMDGLPLIEETELPYKSRHDGKMHACGHDIHMTIAIAVLHDVVNKPINDDVLFIFQPAEEGPGGAQPMLQSEIIKEWKPDSIFALHIAPEYPVGTIATKAGLLFANTSELFIDLVGKGGHAAYPHRTNDMVIAACQLVGQLQTIISRNIDPLDSAVITIGKITGGTVQNIIAETARLEGTIRTLTPESMKKVKSRIEHLVNGVAVGYECDTSIDYGANYYQVFNDENYVNDFMDLLEKKTSIKVIRCKEAMTGEDFGYFLKEIPGFMFWLGAGSKYGLHHAKLNPDEDCIAVGIEAVTTYLRNKGNM